MNVIYFSNLVSHNLFNEIYKKTGVFPSQAIQKFHRLFTEGFPENVQLYKISSLPIPVKVTDKIDFKNFSNEHQLYTGFFKNQYLRQFFNIIYAFIYTFRIHKKNKIEVGVFDYLNQSVTIGGFLACLFLGIKKVVIVTDLPDHPGFIENVSFLSKNFSKLKYKFLNSFDAYILLTHQMNKLVNKRNKPHIIIEGFVDAKYNIENKKNISKEKVFLYAGGLFEVFGIKKLVDTFCEIENNTFELHIYGNGDLKNYLIEKAKQNPQFKFFGEVPNSEIVSKLPKCLLLINPRPSELELTKYSFPSKLMEYMISGTSVLTTKLPGIPAEYDDFLFYFEDESFLGFKNKLSEMMKMQEIFLKQKGENAQEFVFNKKNNLIQGEKIFQFFLSLN